MLTSRSTVALTIGVFTLLGLINGFYLPKLHQLDPSFFWAADAAHYLVAPAVFAVLLVRAGVPPGAYGFTPLPPALTAIEKAALLLGVWGLLLLAYWPAKQIARAQLDGHVDTFVYGHVLPDTGWLRTTAILYFSTTAAIVEESVFRGLPWLLIRQRNRLTVAIYVLLTSLAFSVVHFEQGPEGVVATFSLGLASAILYAKIRNLWPLVVAHFFIGFGAYW